MPDDTEVELTTVTREAKHRVTDTGSPEKSVKFSSLDQQSQSICAGIFTYLRNEVEGHRIRGTMETVPCSALRWSQVVSSLFQIFRIASRSVGVS